MASTNTVFLWQTYIIEDACRGVNTENISNTKSRMKEHGVRFIASSEVGKNFV